MERYPFLKSVKLLVYDCDGVLTDNRVIVDELGHESAIFNRADGYGISRLNDIGIKQLIISTEKSPIVLKRCEKLGLEVIYNCSDKKKELIDYCSTNSIPLNKVMFIGNDLNDLEAMNIAGFRGCPNDAEPEIISVADWVSSKNGGNGVIRELYRLISEV